MQTLVLQGSIRQWVLDVLAGGSPFKAVEISILEELIDRLTLLQYERGETLMRAGEESDSFFYILRGTVEVKVGQLASGDQIEVTQLEKGAFIGEVGTLLKEPREATVAALDQVLALRFGAKYLSKMFKKSPAFGYSVSKGLAKQVKTLVQRTSSRQAEAQLVRSRDEDVLPAVFMRRHQVIAMGMDERVLTLGCVKELDQRVINAAQQFVPGLEIVTVGIEQETFDQAMVNRAVPTFTFDEAGEVTQTTAVSPLGQTQRLDRLVDRMVAEGASDLHLSAGNKPRWRIDGQVMEIAESAVLGSDEVLEILEPALTDHNRAELKESSDTDFAYTSSSGGRVRITLYRDLMGISTALRLIPGKIMTFEQLGLPKMIESLCGCINGLLLVSGPTGSGKSTTLAAMIDRINQTRPGHIITIEDPIESVHRSRRCLVNQREVGVHTPSFARALRAALREDPDVIMVGELRDLDTISLALEAANTGHLVLASLHTVSAVTTMDRIVGAFPAERQVQARVCLSEVVRGVVSQLLCRRTSGGRIAACEVMVVNHAISNLILEGKTAQIPNTMTTARSEGNILLNDSLEHLVKHRVISAEEALAKTNDTKDLARRLGRVT
jgi:twitching motility protein PilT